MDPTAPPKSPVASTPEALADRLRRQSDDIINLWEARVRESIPAALALDPLALRDHIPHLIHSLAKALENVENTEAPKIEIARVHGGERATIPQYSIEQVILEYRILRRTIFDVLTPGSLIDPSARSAIIDAIEVGISESVVAFANYQYRLRDQFVSALAHDLRTPLASAAVCAQLILRSPENVEASQKHAARIVDLIARIDRMIEDLLDSNLVRLGGVLPLRIVPSDLREVVKTTLEECTVAVGNRFSFEPGDAPMPGFWDIRYVKRAIENVAINAVKYGDHGSPVTVTVTQAEQDVAISIHNDGPPIPPAHLETIFDPFQRVGTGKSSGKKGWGIGLSLVRGVCEAHGGTVSVQSQEKTGTTFTLRFPVDARPAADQAA